MAVVRKAIIPVAGMGTRFLPATKAIPKELLPLVDKPVIQFIVEELRDSGVEEIIFVTNESKIAIERHFERDEPLECVLHEKNKHAELNAIKECVGLARYIFIPQTEPLGLGHAVLQARSIIHDEPFIVCGGDDVVEGEPAAKELIEVYQKYGGSVVGVQEVPKDEVDRYGIVTPEKKLDDTLVKISDIIEKPPVEEAASNLAVSGRWLLTPEIFDHLEKTEPGAGGEIQLTDAIRSLMKEQDVYAKTYSGVYRDCGNKAEYVKAVLSFALKNEEVKDKLKEFIKQLDI
ncbi:MAG: UTP--glucose-1-phosphate uridylyltransferase [Candidatus Kerfeldbacteria bacterium]